MSYQYLWFAFLGLHSFHRHPSVSLLQVLTLAFRVLREGKKRFHYSVHPFYTHF